MFDVGFTELLVIAVVALLVLGPERLPRAARMAGLWARRARAQWHSVRAELESEMAADDLRRSLAEAQSELREARGELRDAGSELRNAGTELRDATRESAAPPPSHDDTDGNGTRTHG